MIRALAPISTALAFLTLSACAGAGLDLSDLKAPDQRSVNDSKGGYRRPSSKTSEPQVVADRPTRATDPTGAPVVEGSPPSAGGTGWADTPDSTQPPVFAPTLPPQVPTSTTPEAPAVSSHTTTLPPPPPPPTISRPDQLSPAAGTSDSDPLYFNFMGQIPPELSTDGTWVTPAVGANLAALRGQVVFFVFSFQGCEGCKIFMPTLQQWAETFQRRGATILYVDNGVIDPLDYAKKAMKEQRSTYAYFHDTKAVTIKNYGVRSFPTGYLLDKQGKVIWQGCPTAREGELVPLIEAALAK